MPKYQITDVVNAKVNWSIDVSAVESKEKDKQKQHMEYWHNYLREKDWLTLASEATDLMSCARTKSQLFIDLRMLNALEKSYMQASSMIHVLSPLAVM